jgi:ABC-type enterochelin transport system substrate-binding protein
MQMNPFKLLSRILALAVAATLCASTASAAKYKDNAKDNTITGSVSAVDKGSQAVTVHTAKGDTKVVVDSSTLITKNGAAGTFDDLKTGVNVVVGVFTFGDKLTAISVKIGNPPGATAEAPKKKKKPDSN